MKEAAPCGDCGTTEGFIPKGSQRPERRDGSRFGFADPLCNRCQVRHRRERDGKAPAKKATPKRIDPPKVAINPLDHQGLVYLVALKYQGRGMELEDLVGWGQVGLIKACRKFIPERGFKFTTYAARAIRKTITRAIYEQVPLVRIPEYLAKPIREGATNLGSKEKTERLREALAVLGRTRVTEYGLGESLASVAVARDDDAIARKEAAERAAAILRGLPRREATVLRLRFGIGCDPQSHKEIGAAIGTNQVSAQDLEARAIRRARKQMGRAS